MRLCDDDIRKLEKFDEQEDAYETLKVAYNALYKWIVDCQDKCTCGCSIDADLLATGHSANGANYVEESAIEVDAEAKL